MSGRAVPGSPVYSSFTAQRQLFVDEYLIDLDHGRAHKVAGYAPSKRGHAASGYTLLHRPEIQAAVEERKADRRKRMELEVKQDDVVREIARLAFSDIRRVFAEDGSLLPVPKLDDVTASSIASVKVKYEAGPEDEDGCQTVVQTHEYKLWDKGAAQERLMKHLGGYAQDNAQKSGVFANVPRDKLKAFLDALEGDA